MASNNNDLSLSINANLDTSRVQKTYDQLRNSVERQQLKIPIDVKIDNIMPQLNKNFNQFGQRLDETMGRINTKLSTTVGEINGEFTQLIKTVETYKNKIGDVSERTSIWTKDGQLLASSLNKVKKGITDVKTTTEITIDKVDDFDAKITKVTKSIKDTDNKTKTVITTTKEWIDIEGNLNTEIKTTDENEKQLSATITTVTNDAKKASKAIKDLATETAKLNNNETKTTQTSTFIDENGVKIITKFVNGVQTAKTVISEYQNKLGELVKETKEYKIEVDNLGKTQEKLISIDVQTKRSLIEEREEKEKLIKETADLINKKNELIKTQQQLDKALSSTTTTTKSGKVTEFGDTSGRQYNALITTIREIDATGKTTITTIEEFTNAEGKLVQQTRVTDENLKKLVADNKKVSDSTNNASSGIKNLGSSADKANYGVKNLGWTLSDAFSRLTNFYLASLPIRAMQTAITETITTVKEFDSALIEFRKVSDLAGESLTNYVAKLAEMGEVTGSTMQAMVEASTEFRKSGFSDEDSAKLASIAEKYRNIADEEISAGESASFIIAQMKAFNIEAGQAEHIIDSVNEVANNFSVSSADLATNLGNMSAIMAINNVSMEEQIGMLTGVTEITRNASSASRGLVMVSSRLTQVLDDTSSTGKKLTDIYNKLGIALKDESGQLRSHYDILGDLAKQWNTLSENEQKYIALTSAGARQQQNFVALMQNWNQVASATATAYNSLGSAQKENEKVMDSVEKKVEILTSQFQQLVIGEGGLQDFAKNILDIGIALLKFANSDVGETIIQTTLLITTFVLLKKGIIALTTTAIPKLTASILKLAVVLMPSLEAEIAAAGVEAYSLADAFITLNAAMLANPVAWLVVGLTALVSLTIYATKKAEEHTKRIKEAQEEVEKLKVEIYNLKQAVQDEAQVTQAEKDRLAYLEKRLELQEKLAKFAPSTKTVIPDEYKENLSTMTETGAVEYTVNKRPNISKDELTIYRELNEEIQKWNDNTKEGLELLEEKYNQSQAYLGALEEERNNLGELRDSYSDIQQEYQVLLNRKESGIELSEQEINRLIELKHSQRELSEKDKERLEVLEANIGAYKKSIEQIETYSEAVDTYGDESEEADSILKEFAKDLGISEEELIANANAMGLSVDSYYNCSMAIKQADAAIDNFQSSISVLTNAVNEYNESQEFSIDTVQSLLKLSPEYLGMLIEENGQLKLNENAIVNKANALIEERKQTALQMAYEKLAAIERGNNQAAAESESSAIDGNTSSLDAETTALSKNTVEQYANRIARNDKAKRTAASQVVRELEAELKVLDKIGSSYKSITSSAKKAGKSGASGAKSANNAQKELNKTLEETKSKYEKVISYISKQYDRKTSDLEKAKNAATKPLEAEIKALEAEKNSVLDGIEEEIDAIEEERDGIIKGIEKEIKALENERDTIVDGVEEKIDALEKERDTFVDSISDKIDILEDERDAFLNGIDAKIDALEEEKDKILDNIEAETTALKEQKEERQKYWDAQIDALKKANQERKDALELQEKLDALERARNTKVKIYKEGQGFVYDVDQTKVAEAQKALDEYLSQKAYEDELERLNNLKDAELNNYSDRIDALNKFKDETQSAYETQIKNLKKYREDTSNNYKQQIDDLKNYKDSLKKNYDEQINDLKDYKDNLKKNYDIQIDDLKDYKDSLKEYYDTQLDDLNDYKDGLEKNYEEQINALNDKKDALEEAYDAEIEMYNEYKQQFEDMVNAYQEQQDRLLAEQLTGISFENDNWMTRLDNLANFVNEYNRLQAQLDTGTTNATNTASMSGGGGGGSSTNKTTSTSSSASSAKSSAQYDDKGNLLRGEYYSTNSGSTTKKSTNVGYVPTSVPTSTSGVIKKHASGIGSIKDDEIAIVGENPNKEIVLGSKVNNGQLMALNRGAGVVNADSSNTLASMLNQVGKFGSSGFGSGNGTLNNNINNDSLVVNGVTIEGSQINDPQTFVNGLLNLKAEALQRAYRHR